MWYNAWGLRDNFMLFVQPGATFELNIELLRVTPPPEEKWTLIREISSPNIWLKITKEKREKDVNFGVLYLFGVWLLYTKLWYTERTEEYLLDENLLKSNDFLCGSFSLVEIC